MCALKVIQQLNNTCWNNYLSAFGHDLRELTTLQHNITHKLHPITAPISRRSIVAEVLPANSLLEAHFSMAEIGVQFGGATELERQDAALQWMAKHGLIANERLCKTEKTEKCETHATLVRDSTLQDGFIVS